MDVPTYSIFPTSYGWTITRYHHIFGVYPTRQQAIEVVRVAAEAEAHHGVNAIIAVVAEDGETELLPSPAPLQDRRRRAPRPSRLH